MTHCSSYPCLENSVDRGAWWATVTESDTAHIGLPGGARGVKNLPANTVDVRDTGSIPGSRRSPGGGHGNPLQDSCLENPMDRGSWWTMIHRVAESWIQLK